jgi:hypothetical protein
LVKVVLLTLVLIRKAIIITGMSVIAIVRDLVEAKIAKLTTIMFNNNLGKGVRAKIGIIGLRVRDVKSEISNSSGMLHLPQLRQSLLEYL